MNHYSKDVQREALDALDNLIRISRVEMYKPIQVAEVLYRLRTGSKVTALDLDSYKNPSIHWRDSVTERVMGKRSTSSAQFQHHVWGDSAIPPKTLDVLAQINSADGSLEKKIYLAVLSKQVELIEFRSKLLNLSDSEQLQNIFQIFSNPSLSTSRDRLFEIIVECVFQSLVQETKLFLSIHGFSDKGSNALMALKGLVSAKQIPLKVARLGRTNAADAGIDVWTNFGVLVNIKHREIDLVLLEQILNDTPKGELLIVCKSVSLEALDFLSESSERNVAFVTIQELWEAVDDISKTPDTWRYFKEQLQVAFDLEFPMATSLSDFLLERKYI